MDLVYNNTNIPIITAPANIHGFVNNPPILDNVGNTLENPSIIPPAAFNLFKVVEIVNINFSIGAPVFKIVPIPRLNKANAPIAFINPLVNFGFCFIQVAIFSSIGLVAVNKFFIEGANAKPTSAKEFIN